MNETLTIALSKAFVAFLSAEGKAIAKLEENVGNAETTLAATVSGAFSSSAPSEADYVKERRAIVAVALKAIIAKFPALEERKQKKAAQNLVTRAVMRACQTRISDAADAPFMFYMPDVKGAVREQSAGAIAASAAAKALKQAVDSLLVVKGKTDAEITSGRAQLIALAKVDPKLESAFSGALAFLKTEADKKQAAEEKKLAAAEAKKLADLKASIRAEIEAELKLAK